MGGSLGKKQNQGPGKSGESSGLLPLPGTSSSGFGFGKGKKNPLRHRNSLSEFSLTDLASNITNRFSVLSGLSFISIVSVPATEAAKRPWSRVSRKRWNQTTLQNEYHQCKTVWPVAQTEALFLPEFPVGIEEKLKLILLGEISRGAFGQVFHVRCSTSHKEYAMKVLSKSQVCSLDSVRQVKQEVMIQHVCSHHPFIAPLTHFWQTRKLLIIMTEYIGYGELHQLWRSLGRLPEQLLSLYVAEIALALDFLHNAGIIYRDLKMENILLDVDGHIKLIDFGLSRWLTYGGHTSTICGTLQFMAPEVLKGEEYGHPADWWSLGIIAYSLYLGHYPVSGYDDHVTMGGAVEKFVYSPPESASKAMKSLITGLLQRSPATRIHTLHQLQKEELFMHIDFDDVRDKKMSPRLALEKYIEGKSRHNFEEFEGLTSTPKRGMPSSECDLGPNSSIPNKLTRSPLMGGRAIMWDRAKRSCSSPLLSSPLMHPGRLGHHDALIKSVSATGYNGAAVPLLQSPLLRLARGQRVSSRSKQSQRAVSASALPTAVSPLLVNVRGNRRERWQVRERDRKKILYKDKDKETDSSSSPVQSPVRGGAIRRLESVHQKFASEECVRDAKKTPDDVGIKRSKTDIDTPICSSNFVPWNAYEPGGSETEDIMGENFLQNGENFEEEFYNGLVTSSTPKRGSERHFQNDSLLREPNNFRAESCPPKAVNLHGQQISSTGSSSSNSKCGLINGAPLGNNNTNNNTNTNKNNNNNNINNNNNNNNNINNNPLDEKDLDATLEHFPYISESLDTT